MPRRTTRHRPHRPTTRQHCSREHHARLPHRRLYKLRVYERFRKMILAERPLCEDCGVEPSFNIHHIDKVRHDPTVLLDPDRVMALCHRCHSRRTGRGE